MTTWRELAAERAALVERATALTRKTPFTQEDANEVDRLMVRIDSLAEQIGRMTRTDALTARDDRQTRSRALSVWGAPNADLRQRSGGADQPNGGAFNMEQERWLPAWARSENTELQHRAFGVAAEPRYQEAFSRWLRHGETPEDRSVMAPGFSRDLVVGTGASGGYIVPPQFLQQLVEAQLAYGGMRQISTIINTSAQGGADLPVPTDNDTAQAGAILSEAGALPAQDIGAFAQTVLHSYMYTSKLVKVSIQLMQDAFFPMEPYLAVKLAIRLARIQNTHFTVGTGAAQPNGVITAATLGKTGLSGQTLTVIYDDLVDLIHSVDPAYRVGTPGVPRQLYVGNGVPMPRPCFMFHDSTLKILRKLKDTQGHTLWAPPGMVYPGFAGQAPDTILGYPYIVNNDVPVMAANAKSILFGDFSNYFIRDALDVMLIRLDERYADTLEVGFIAFQRTDGNLINAGTNPVKYYANSAT
jgi:HK97 family phage major capsid protein